MAPLTPWLIFCGLHWTFSDLFLHISLVVKHLIVMSALLSADEPVCNKKKNTLAHKQTLVPMAEPLWDCSIEESGMLGERALLVLVANDARATCCQEGKSPWRSTEQRDNRVRHNKGEINQWGCCGCVGFQSIMSYFIPQTAGVPLKGICGLLCSKYPGLSVPMCFTSTNIHFVTHKTISGRCYGLWLGLFFCSPFLQIAFNYHQCVNVCVSMGGWLCIV